MSNNNSSNDWCTIESDPGILTEMLEMLQCPCIEFNELYSLDDDTLLSLQSNTRAVYGFIFLFQYNHRSENSSTTTTTASRSSIHEEPPSDLFFAHQVTTNACATQAVLSILFNSIRHSTTSSTSEEPNQDATISSLSEQPQQQQQLLTPEEVGPVLYPFYTFVSSFPYDLKGVAISSSEEIKQAHNTFARSESMYMDTVSPRTMFDPLRHEKSEDVFHFISYVPHYATRTVYELDGLQPSPIALGTFDSNDDQSSGLYPWIIVARNEIQKRIETIGVDNVKFNLMAMIHDRRQFYMQSLQLQPNDDTNMILEENDANGHDDDLHLLLEEENRKRMIWKKENERRKHNYIPFVVQYLRQMAKTTTVTSESNDEDHDDTKKSSSLLQHMIEIARERQLEKKRQPLLSTKK